MRVCCAIICLVLSAGFILAGSTNWWDRIDDVPEIPNRALPVWFRHARMLHRRVALQLSTTTVGRGMDAGMRDAVVIPSLDRFTRRYAIPAGRFGASDTFKAWAEVWERVYEEHPDGFIFTPDPRAPFGARRLAIAERLRTHGLTPDTERAVLRYYEDLAAALQRRKSAASKRSK